MNFLTLMETFAVVVETGSFTAAAEQLGLSKAFVSKQVSALEKELGTRLLYRTTRKLSLSEEGTRLYNHCQLIMREAQNARAEIIESQSTPRGRINITIPQSLIISGVGSLLLDFQVQYPDIELNVIASGRVEDLVEKGIDLALRVGQLEDSTLISRKLADCNFQVVAAHSYLVRNGEPTEPADLTHHNCLIYGESRSNRNWPFQLNGGEIVTIKVNGNLTCNDGTLIYNAVLNGQGIGYGPGFLYQKPLEDGRLKSLLSEFSQPTTAISALYPQNRNPSRRVRILLDYLAERLNS